MCLCVGVKEKKKKTVNCLTANISGQSLVQMCSLYKSSEKVGQLLTASVFVTAKKLVCGKK